jgi:hypothetical protein
MTETPATFMPNSRAGLESGGKLAEQRCPNCGSLMVIVGELLDP